MLLISKSVKFAELVHISWMLLRCSYHSIIFSAISRRPIDCAKPKNHTEKVRGAWRLILIREIGKLLFVTHACFCESRFLERLVTVISNVSFHSCDGSESSILWSKKKKKALLVLMIRPKQNLLTIYTFSAQGLESVEFCRMGLNMINCVKTDVALEWIYSL